MAGSERRSRELIDYALTIGYIIRRSSKRGTSVQLRHAVTGVLVTIPRQLATVGRNGPNHKALIRRGARGQ